MSIPPPSQEPQIEASLASPLHILIVEDMQAMAQAINLKVEKLRGWFPNARITITATWADAFAIVNTEPPPDGTLLDLSLPDSAMHDTISRIETISRRTAVVIITGHAKEKVLNLLADKETPILEKTPQLFLGDGILLALIRAIRTRKRAESEKRMATLDNIHRQLEELQHAAPA